MKLITKDSDYAIRALCALDFRKNKMLSTKDLVEITKIPRPFLRKIMQRLGSAGIVNPCKGKNGGFSLKKKLKNLSLLEIIETFQGKVTFINHTFKYRRCPHASKCKLKRNIDRLEDKLVKDLRKIKLASLT